MLLPTAPFSLGQSVAALATETGEVVPNGIPFSIVAGFIAHIRAVRAAALTVELSTQIVQN